jgi:hypothetical protein
MDAVNIALLFISFTCVIGGLFVALTNIKPYRSRLAEHLKLVDDLEALQKSLVSDSVREIVQPVIVWAEKLILRSGVEAGKNRRSLIAGTILVIIGIAGLCASFYFSL